MASSLLLGGARAGAGGGAGFGNAGSAGIAGAAIAGAGASAGAAARGTASGGCAMWGIAGMGGGGGAENCGAEGGGAAGEGAGADGDFGPSPEIMRVNSPGSELGGAGAGGTGDGRATGMAFSSESRWISRVTPPGSSACLGGVYDGKGSGRYGAGSCGFGGAVPAPDPESDERMPVTLDEDPAGAEVFSVGRKNGSSFHELSAAGGGGGGAATGGCGAGRCALLKNCVKLPSEDAAGGGGAGAGAAAGAGRDALLKNCVKPPSPDAESEAPGEEKPLGPEGPEEGGAGRGVSSEGRAEGVLPGVMSETMIRVNSPGPDSAAGGCAGPLTTCVETCGISFGGGGVAGRGPRLLKSCVNSPGPADAPGLGAGGAGLAGWAGNASAGFESFFPS
jgi:hypothetical protein